MSEKNANSGNNDDSDEKVPLKLNIGYAIGEITDMVAYQGFSFLIFTFYSVVMGVNTSTITVVFIIWSIFNAFNDPILGALSDRTKTKHLGGGRRLPWIVSMLIPLSLIMVLLFTPPGDNDITRAVYMCFIMILFDTIYTAYSINHTSLYPEMFRTNAEREQAGRGRRIAMVLGLILAVGLPGLFITQYTGDREVAIAEYRMAGIAMGVVIFITMLIHIKFGIKEPPVEEIKEKEILSFKESLKVTLKNKNFLILVGASSMNWYVFTLIPLILPIYVAGALGEPNADSTTLLLLIAFLSSAIGVVIWSKVDAKVGSKTGLIIAMFYWALTSIPYLFVTEYNIALICMVFTGIGLGGPPYFIDRNVSNVADADELKTKCRREASYYGINAVFIRLAIILVILSINTVFQYNGWEEPDVATITEGQKFGLRLLMSVFPAVAMLIGILCLKFFPYGKKEVQELQSKMKEFCAAQD